MKVIYILGSYLTLKTFRDKLKLIGKCVPSFCFLLLIFIFIFFYYLKSLSPLALQIKFSGVLQFGINSCYCEIVELLYETSWVGDRQESARTGLERFRKR
jgi:hypothetical protein